MAITPGAAYVSVLPSTDKIAPGIRRALGAIEDGPARRSSERNGDSFADSFRSRVGGALKASLIAGAAGAGLLGGLGVATAAAAEQTQISLETLLGSSKRAKAEMEWLNEASAATPFELADLAQADKTLAGFGMTSDRTRRAFLTDMGNIAAAVGLPSNRLGDLAKVLGQVHASGKASMEDINQLIDAGVPVWDALGKQTGMSAAEMRDAISTGQLSARTFEKAMSNIARNRFGDAMAKQSQSLNGLASTFRDTLGQGVASAIGPALPALKAGLAGAIVVLPPILDGLSAATALIAEVVTDAVRWGGEHETALRSAATAVVILAPAFLAYAAATKIAALVTGDAVDEQKKARARLALNPAALTVGVLAGLAVVLFVAWKRSETFRNIVTGALGTVAASARAVGAFFTQTVPAAFGVVTAWVRANWPKIVVLLTGPVGLAVLLIARNGARIEAGAGAAKDWVVGRFRALGGFVKGLPGAFGSVGSQMWQSAREGFRSVVNAVIRMWNGISFSLPSVAFLGGGGGQSFTFETPDIPMLAKGGVVRSGGRSDPLDTLEPMIERTARTVSSSGRYDDVEAIAEHYKERGRDHAADALPPGDRVKIEIADWRTGRAVMFA